MRERILIAAATTLSLVCWGTAQAQDNNSQGNNERQGTMQLVKNCDLYQGNPGNWCAITESSLPQIPVNTSPDTATPTGTVVYYTLGMNIPGTTNPIIPNVVDSNIVLDAGNGNRAVGRCTFDGTTNTGLCDYTDGTGTLAGFSARLVVTPDPPGSLTTSIYFLNGPYVFKNTTEPPS
jgi:hypothetical protein